MTHLCKWMKSLSATLFKLLPEMAPGTYERMKEKMVSHWKLYEEPQLDEHGNLIKKLVKVES